jgi:hypothetical protein
LEHFDHGQKNDSHDSCNSHAPDDTQSTSTRSVERWLIIPIGSTGCGTWNNSSMGPGQ